MDLGRAIYYELSTGNVILDTGERSGDVVATTEAQDFALYAALQPYQQSSVGVLQIPFGQDDANFAKYPYHVDIAQSPPVIVWDTTATDLASAQAQKIAQLRAMYNQALTSGFNVTLSDGKSYAFGWSTDDLAHLDATRAAVNDGYLTFPVAYADVNGAPVSIASSADLDTIKSTSTKFMVAQHQQVMALVGQAQSATTVTAVNAVQWSAATY